jgi:hypothetical protein
MVRALLPCDNNGLSRAVSYFLRRMEVLKLVYDSFPLRLKEEHRLRMHENRVMRRMHLDLRGRKLQKDE